LLQIHKNIRMLQYSPAGRGGAFVILVYETITTIAEAKTGQTHPFEITDKAGFTEACLLDW
jgi:hypothetical protein